MELDDLADLIWPDRLPPAWERDLSAVVSKLRRLLRSASDGARATIKGATGCYELVLPPGSTVDVTEAAGAVDRARAELGHGRLEEARLAAEEAAAVARRPLLPGTSAVWLDERRQWLRGVLVQALAVQVEVAIRRHDPAGVRAANEAVAADPTSEPAYANQMRLYLSLGETAAALETYERYRAAVVDDLGLPAAPELEALFAAARAGSASLPGPAPASHPPSGRVGLLPRPATTFVGRKPDLVAVDAALRQAKIVTITGPAGVGKSRLALEAARRVVGHYRDGVRSCELAHVSHPEVRSQSQPLQARMPWRLLSRAAAVGMQAVEHPARCGRGAFRPACQIRTIPVWRSRRPSGCGACRATSRVLTTGRATANRGRARTRSPVRPWVSHTFCVRRVNPWTCRRPGFHGSVGRSPLPRGAEALNPGIKPLPSNPDPPVGQPAEPREPGPTPAPPRTTCRRCGASDEGIRSVADVERACASVGQPRRRTSQRAFSGSAGAALARCVRVSDPRMAVKLIPTCSTQTAKE